MRIDPNSRQLVQDVRVVNQLPSVSIAGSVAVTGPLTNSQLRAAPVDIALSDNMQSAFGWMRTADPIGQFESSMTYDLEPTQWETSVSGTGSVTHLPLKATAELSTGGTASGAKCIRQSKPYSRYQPGKGQLILQSFALGAAATNLRRRIGYFDADGGVFLEQTSTGLRLVRRTKVSGAVVDNAVESAAWNTGTVIDPTKCALMFISFEWLGVGRVSVGFANATTGELDVAYTFLNAQVLNTVWTTTASLPCRIEVENTGTTSGTNTLHQICTAVMSEGGFESPKGYGASAANGTTTIAVTARRPVLSIQHALTFPTASTIVNRASIEAIEAEMYAKTNDCFWEIVIGGTLTGAAFADVGATTSCMQRDVTATAITGGTTIDSGYGVSGSGAFASVISHDLYRKVPLGLDISGANPNILSIVCTPMTGTSNVAAAIRWKELR
jgi:hypothetical protein